MKSSIFKNTRLALALPFVLAFAGTSFATKGDLGGDSYAGTEAKPYQISDAADLMAFAKKVNEEGKYDAWAVLTGDICMNACGEGESVLTSEGALNGDGSKFTPWTPIGTSVNVYMGTFDGKEFAISGLYFNNSTANVGLFGYISGATVLNVGVIDSYLGGYENVGGVVGRMEGGLVSNAYNTGAVSGTGYLGGVVGRMEDGSVSNSYNTGSVSASGNFVGGVVAYNKNGTISNAYNTGAVSGWNNVGGVTGNNYGGTFSNSYNRGSVSGNQAVGGVAGINNGTVSNSYNRGSVSGTQVVGGVTGLNNGGTISNSYNRGSVSGTQSVGGVTGYNNNASVENAYNVGSVSKTTDNEGKNFGSVAGVNAGTGTFVNVYYNSESSSFKAIGAADGTNSDVDGTTGKTAAEFASGTVAKLLHDWCEKDGDVCKEGGLNGSIWGQDLTKENSKPEFIERLDYKLGSVTFFEKASKIDSVHVDAASDLSVYFPEDVEVSGPVKFKRSFSNDGHSTIMLPFAPNFAADEDTIAGVNFYEFCTYAEGKVEVTHVGQKDLKASTPYLVRAAGATELVFKNGGTFNTTTGDGYDKIRKVYKTTIANGWTVYGTYEYKTWEKGDAGLGKTYGFAGSNGYDPNVVGKFKKVGAGAYTFPMRAYLEYENPVKKVRTAPNSARAAASVTASLPETIDVVVVEKDAKTGEETTKLIGSINSRTGEFKAVDRYFDLNGRNVGKKPAAKGSFYRK